MPIAEPPAPAPAQPAADAGPRIQRALVSVSDKTGLAEFAAGLAAAGVELYSTGGSAKCLADAGVPVRDVADYTGFPEMMDGRLKTLHPLVHGGILARRDNGADMASANEHGIVPFELVVVNLYPFREAVADPRTTYAERIEKIDIGGPTMVRAAAKNHRFVTIASAPAQYAEILEEVQAAGATSRALREKLAGAAFAHTARYDAAIAEFFANEQCQEYEDWPAIRPVWLEHKASLRYGENPHQQAALYADADAPAWALVNAEQLHGKELSYNNWLDLDAAIAAAWSLPAPGVVVLKHNNPCGAATAETIGEATRRAWDGDPVSAFGSILGFNAPVDAAAAECLTEPGKFVEAIVAPDFTPEAIEILTTKPKWKASVRLLRSPRPDARSRYVLRAIEGGYLVQSGDTNPDQPSLWKVVTQAKPTDEQLAELRFAWAACRHVKSNAIVLSRGNALVGVGAGQMSRVDSVEIAIKKAGDRTDGAVLASDAFFPFDDSIHTAAAAGVCAVIQPGGSKRDQEVIAACDQHGLPMVFTGERHFRH
ncbi:MAG: bifunctional phosphoribosylaminoimidazolecarboxamide formyltransferase/IMP cyclohydrolase [Planctomycetota bacterium]